MRGQTDLFDDLLLQDPLQVGPKVLWLQVYSLADLDVIEHATGDTSTVRTPTPALALLAHTLFGQSESKVCPTQSRTSRTFTHAKLIRETQAGGSSRPSAGIQK